MSTLTTNRQAENLLGSKPPGAMCLDGDIRLGSLTLNHIDEDGHLWIVTDVDGWWTLPEPDLPDYTRGVEDGSYETVGRYNARTFTLAGTFVPATSADLRVARAKLVEAANLCHVGAWFVTHELDYTRGSMVWISGAPQIQTTSTSGKTDFSITLKAPDPIKYSLNGDAAPGWYTQSRTGAGNLTVTNEGNFEVQPIITIHGPTSGAIRLTNLSTGEVVDVVKSVPSVSNLIINSRSRSVSLDDQRNQRRYLKWDTDWMNIAPGDNVITVAAVGGTTLSTAVTTVQWRHGWIG